MAAKQKSAVDRLREKAQAEFEAKLNKGIVEKLAERDPQLLDELATAVEEDMQKPKPKRTRAAKKTKPAAPDASAQPGEVEQSQQHEGDGHHGG